jgi:hypothetical protein
MGQNSSITNLFRQIGDIVTNKRSDTRNPYMDDNTKRIITINSGPQSTNFITNHISTSKYSILTFLPKFLFEQFRKYSNIFFLLIVIFQVNRRRKKKNIYVLRKILFSKFPVYHQQEDIQHLFP